MVLLNKAVLLGPGLRLNLAVDIPDFLLAKVPAANARRCVLRFRGAVLRPGGEVLA